MSKKLNEKFVKIYNELDKACCEKFGVSAGGVTEYINRLNNARYAPGRDLVLPKLASYKNTKTSFDNSASALRKSNAITKDDLKWLAAFEKRLLKKKDPVSEYLRKARNYSRRRKAKRVLIAVLVIAIIVAVAVGVMFM